jgi:flagellar hook-associated protein 2
MAVSTTSTGTLSSAGIGSGLDVNSIVGQLMAIEQRPLTLLSRKEASYQTKLTAYGSLKGALSTFQSTMQTLSTAAKFQGLTASAGDSSILTASATSGGSAGSYTINVGNIAQSQVLAATGVASLDNPSSTGTLSIQVGSGALKTVTIDASNNTLSGLRDAINAAAAGVTATLVNDGSATPYKLVLSADTTGAANTIQITNNLTAGELATTVTSLAQVRAATNAALTVNGVSLSSASNTVSSAIPGVTLALKDSGSTTVTVARDTAAAQAAVADFVKAYNDINGTITNLTSYDAKTKKGGPLLGDFAAQNLQTQIRKTLSQNLAGIGGSLTTLSQVGVAFQKDGTLALDATKLGNATSSSFGDLAALFAVQGKSSNSLLSFVSAAAKSTPGTYSVDITSAASRGSATAVSAPAGSTLIDDSNNAFSIIIDGVTSGPLKLANNAAYTPAQLAGALQTAINSAAPFVAAGVSATVALDAGKLAITSQRYGSGSSVATITGTAIIALGFSGGESGAGSNVAGSFTLNGTTIAASGIGQILTGATGTAGEGLQVKFTGTPAQVAVGSDATLNFSGGYATLLNKLATTALDDGAALAGRKTGLDKSLEEITSQREKINRQLTAVEARYRAQFGALDTLISNLNSTSSFLTQQIAFLPTPGKSTAK